MGFRKSMLSTLALLTAVSLVGTIAWGEGLTRVVTVDRSDLFMGRRAGYDVVELAGYRYATDIGKPMLPLTIETVELPGLVAISGVAVVSLETEGVEGDYTVLPAQEPLPVMRAAHPAIEFVPPDPQVYGSSQPYPESVVELVNVADREGRTIAHIRVSPVQYVPGEGRLLLNRRIEYTVYYQVVGEAEPRPVSIPPGDYDYAIVTRSTLVSAFQPLADWKTKKGVKAIIVTTDDVQDWYGGTGTSEFRSFVRDAHQEWGAAWILLGGDVDIVPEAWKSFSGPGSTYGDTYYGDYDDDWVCEVAVGRAPVNTATEVQTFVDKVLLYEKDPPLTNYPLDVTLIMMDADASTHCEDASEDYIVPNIPGRFDITKVYDSDSGNHETKAKDAFNDGQNISIHADHAWTDGIGVGSVNHGWYLESYELADFTNYDRTTIMYTLGCHPGDFEASDCFGECWVVKHAHTVGVAFIGNAGYGYYDYGCCECLSGAYMVAFSHSLFAEELHHLGDAFNDHKNDTPPGSDEYMKYCFYTLSLLGDPEMPVWTDVPKSLSVTHPDSAIVGGAPFTVYVELAGSPLEGGLVCLVKDDDVYETGYTGGDGRVTLYPEPQSTGTMDVTVTARNGLPYGSSVPVIPAEGPYIAYTNHVVDDDREGTSWGNCNGQVNPGERIELPVVVRNFGKEDAYGVQATLAVSGDPYVTVTDQLEWFGDIASGDTALSGDDFDFEVSSDCPDGHEINFVMNIQDEAENAWVSYFSVPVVIPPILLDPDDTIVPRGGTLGFTITVMNKSGESVGLVVWTEVTLPSGEPFAGNPVAGPKYIYLTVDEVVSVHLSHPVPRYSPLGTYTYTAKMGTYPDPVEASGSFTFTVVD
jgi:hypothetical protein